MLRVAGAARAARVAAHARDGARARGVVERRRARRAPRVLRRARRAARAGRQAGGSPAGEHTRPLQTNFTSLIVLDPMSKFLIGGER